MTQSCLTKPHCSEHVSIVVIPKFVYYNGETEIKRENEKCQCYEGQRVETWGCQGPSHTGLIIIHTIWIHRSLRSRSRHHPCGGRVPETEESICMCERGVWGRGVWGKGKRTHRHYLCRQVHIGYKTVGCLLWIIKARVKDKKLYMDFGVMKG